MIDDIVFKNQRILSNKIALKTKSEETSYGELQNFVREFSSYLLEQGIRKEDRVLLFLNNRPEFIVTYFATLLIGAVVVMVDTKLNQEVEDILNTNKIKLVVTDQEEWKKIANAQNVKSVIVDQDSRKQYKLTEGKILEEYLSQNKRTEDDLAVILYTSGSTSGPKGVLNTHRNIEESLKNYTETLPLNSEDIFLGVTPFFHSYCMGSCMLAAIYLGSTLLLLEHFIPRRVLKLIESNRATVFHGVPFMYKILTAQAEKYDLSSLRICISAGSQLDEQILKDFYSVTHKVIHQEYGSSETGTIAVNLSDDLEKAIKYVGKPLENVEVELVPVGESEMTLGKIKSKAIAQGYINGEQFDKEGYLTQDICEIVDGYISIKGRINRLINITGLKVNPVEVENCLRTYPGITDAYVRAKKHECLGNIIEALVVRDNAQISTAEVMSFCKERLAAYKVPNLITWVEEIAKSGTGKSISV